MKLLLATLIGLFVPLTASCQDVPESKAHSTSEPSLKLQTETSWYAVTKVADDDVLNMRSEPQAKANIVYHIPYDAGNVLKLEESNGWYKVHYRGHSGWVYGKYLRKQVPENATDVFNGELFCFGTEPHWNLKTQSETAALSDMEDDKSLLITSRFRNSINRADVWLLSLSSPEKKGLFYQGVIQKLACSDGMSDQAYPYQIHLLNTHHTQLISGYCKIQQ